MVENIWKEPGGTMSAVQVPESNGAFIATHRFYSPNDCKEASLILAYFEDGTWKIKTLAELPGVHRLDILTNKSGDHYLIACSIKDQYEERDDWRYPGSVYACLLPADLLHYLDHKQLELNVLAGGFYRNHGYFRYEQGKTVSGIVTCDQGIFRFTPPDSVGKPWSIDLINDQPTSDAVLFDLDKDGKDELITLSPFHGDTLRVYRETESKYELIYEYQERIEFAHAISPAYVSGEKILVIGHRAGGRDLLALRYGQNGYFIECLDHDVGPANVMYMSVNNEDVLVAANREINEVAYYVLGKGMEN